jgi:hypothetical protein
LFLAGLVTFIKSVFSKDKLTVCLMASLFCSLICAFGMFQLQLGVNIFYILVISGLLYNSKNINMEEA